MSHCLARLIDEHRSAEERFLHGIGTKGCGDEQHVKVNVLAGDREPKAFKFRIHHNRGPTLRLRWIAGYWAQLRAAVPAFYGGTLGDSLKPGGWPSDILVGEPGVRASRRPVFCDKWPCLKDLRNLSGCKGWSSWFPSLHSSWSCTPTGSR